jgi:hypothetical protein
MLPHYIYILPSKSENIDPQWVLISEMLQLQQKQGICKAICFAGLWDRAF